jgi:phosphoribosylformylglycinamidine synthase
VISRRAPRLASHRDLRKAEVLQFRSGTPTGTTRDETLDALEAKGRILFRYVVNPNGAERSIAGMRSERGNVVALMPHPDRCYEPDLGTDHGRRVFESLVAWTKEHA